MLLFFFLFFNPTRFCKNKTLHANFTRGVPVRVSNAGRLCQEERGRVRDDQRRFKRPEQQVPMPGCVPVIPLRPEWLECRAASPGVSPVRPDDQHYLDNDHVYTAAAMSDSEVQAT